MIPKKIHYCWFGRGEKSALANRCMASWEKFCPDYDIIEWNEDNFNLDYNGYTRYCYDNKKWAFLSDFVRLIVVAEQGGLYFDTDVELLENPDFLLKYEAFYGFEKDDAVATGLGFGAEANHPSVVAMREEFEKISPNADGTYPVKACPALNTAALMPYGLKLDGKKQNVLRAEIFPAEYFNPYDDPTGRLCKTKNTVSVHWYSKSWMNKKTVIRSKLTRPLHKIFGVTAFQKLKK